MLGDFNTHYAKWLKLSNVTDVASIQTFNFFIVQSLSQIVDFPTRFPNNFDQHASLLGLFFNYSPSSCKASQHCPLSNLYHAIVSVDISFRSSIKKKLPIHKTSFCDQHIDWDLFFEAP